MRSPLKVPLHIQILLAMAVGMVTGLGLGKDASQLGEVGKFIIQLIKVAAAPLLFFSILNAILKTEVGLKSGLRMVVIATVNALLALSLGLVLSNVLKPGLHLNLTGISGAEAAKVEAHEINFLRTFGGYIPTSIVQPFADNVVLTLVAMSLFLGFALRRARTEQIAEGRQGYRAIEENIESLLRATELILGWVILLIPLAVFSVVAKTIGEYGFAPLKGLGMYVIVGLLGMGLQILVTYQIWIAFYARMPLVFFWRNAKEAVIYAMGANSSLATLPVTLKGLDRMGVSKSSSTLGACVGTNLNNDGIILYEAMAVLLVAQASGIELSFSQQLLAAVASLVAAMGIAGVPEAGFISLSLVLATVKLPLELLPLLLTVDWILARARSVTNVLSDMTVSIILDRWDRGPRRV